jgi:hypothetical protein
MYQFERKDLIDAIRETVGVEPTVWECECGCNGQFAFARDHRALWFASALNIHPTINIVGLQNEAELTTFLMLLAMNLNEKTVTPLAAVMRAAWEQKEQTPS